jgi:hypothetical protein
MDSPSNKPFVKDLDGSTFPALFYLSSADKNLYTQGDVFAPVPIHAGGIAWYKNFIYVVDTKMGIRVFDPTRIYKVARDLSKSRCGKFTEANGTVNYFAFDYEFIMPQIGYYRTYGTDPNSFISVGNRLMDNKVTWEPCLWMGQHLSNDAGSKFYIGKLKARESWTSTEMSEYPKLFRLLLNSDGSINTGAVIQPYSPKDEGTTPVYGMQGAYRAYQNTWESVTGMSCYENSTARLFAQISAKTNRWRWPLGAESLYLDESKNRLWCLTEYPNGYSKCDVSAKRIFFSVDFGSYQSW